MPRHPTHMHKSCATGRNVAATDKQEREELFHFPFRRSKSKLIRCPPSLSSWCAQTLLQFKNVIRFSFGFQGRLSQCPSYYFWNLSGNMCSYSTKLALFQWQCIKVCNSMLCLVLSKCRIARRKLKSQLTWLLEELIGVGSKVIPLGLDEVRRQFLAPFQKNIRFHVRRFSFMPL